MASWEVIITSVLLLLADIALAQKGGGAWGDGAEADSGWGERVVAPPR